MNAHTPTSPLPAYEAKPMQQFPELHSPAPAPQGMTVYGSTAGQQQGGATQQNYLQDQAISPLASPVQQPQGMASEKQDYYTPYQQSQQQQQQLNPQQQSQQQLPPHQQPQQYQQTYQTAVPLANLQEAAAPVDCPVCRHRALTVVEKVSGNTVHAWAALTCLIFCLGCIPYLITSLKDSQHKCGHCGVLLAVWHNSGRTVVLQHA